MNLLKTWRMLCAASLAAVMALGAPASACQVLLSWRLTLVAAR